MVRIKVLSIYLTLYFIFQNIRYVFFYIKIILEISNTKPVTMLFLLFYSFQKDVNIRKLWIEATGRENWEPTKYTRMCSRHFEPHCFRKTQSLTYLNEHSIPKLHINVSFTILYI